MNKNKNQNQKKKLFMKVNKIWIKKNWIFNI